MLWLAIGTAQGDFIGVTDAVDGEAPRLGGFRDGGLRGLDRDTLEKALSPTTAAARRRRRRRSA